MREIKFRVWSNQLNKMVYPGDTGWFDECFIGDNGVFQSCQLGTVIEKNGKELDVLQYTGLHDKNGREIYEGDIVEQELLGNAPLDFGSFIGVVKFIDGTYMIENAEGTFGVELFSETNPNEVIGNIYENPSLLEGDGE